MTQFEIVDDQIDAVVLADRVRARLNNSDKAGAAAAMSEAQNIAVELRQQLIDRPETSYRLNPELLLHERDADIVPRTYRIAWQMPILGPINALLRRFIHNEIQRFLGLALERQSFLNRQLLKTVAALVEENQRLRQEIERLHAQQLSTDRDQQN
jgi:hypothetical protein